METEQQSLTTQAPVADAVPPTLEPVSDRHVWKSGELLVEVELDVMNDSHIVGSGFIAPLGKSRCTISRADYERNLREVEDEKGLEAWARAEDRYAKALEKYTAKVLEDEGVDLPEAKRLRAEQCAATIPASPAGFFFAEMERGRKPLRSIKIVRDGIAAPADVARVDDRAEFAKTLGAEIAAATANANDPDRLAAALGTALEGAVARILDRLDSKKAK